MLSPRDLYDQARSFPSDINEHVEILFRYASVCNSVTEFGTRFGVSTAAFLFAEPEELRCYDLVRQHQVDVLMSASKQTRTKMSFNSSNVLEAEIMETDLLFIDTWHSYNQMRAELKLHGHKAKKYLIFHDTETFGTEGQTPGEKGIWPAIAEYCRAHQEWRLVYHSKINNGLSILAREN